MAGPYFEGSVTWVPTARFEGELLRLPRDRGGGRPHPGAGADRTRGLVPGAPRSVQFGLRQEF